MKEIFNILGTQGAEKNKRDESKSECGDERHSRMQRFAFAEAEDR